MKELDFPIRGEQKLALLDVVHHADLEVVEILSSDSATTDEIHESLNAAFDFCRCETELALERLENADRIKQSTNGMWYMPKQ